MSETGLGLLARMPLSVGSLVTVSGDLHSVDACWRLDTQSRVVHCLAQEDSAFRVGLAFQEGEHHQKLECSHEPGFSLSLDLD